MNAFVLVITSCLSTGTDCVRLPAYQDIPGQLPVPHRSTAHARQMEQPTPEEACRPLCLRRAEQVGDVSEWRRSLMPKPLTRTPQTKYIGGVCFMCGETKKIAYGDAYCEDCHADGAVECQPVTLKPGGEQNQHLSVWINYEEDDSGCQTFAVTGAQGFDELPDGEYLFSRQSPSLPAPDLRNLADQIAALKLHPTTSDDYCAGYIAARNDAFAIIQEAIDNA